VARESVLRELPPAIPETAAVPAVLLRGLPEARMGDSPEEHFPVSDLSERLRKGSAAPSVLLAEMPLAGVVQPQSEGRINALQGVEAKRRSRAKKKSSAGKATKGSSIKGIAGESLPGRAPANYTSEWFHSDTHPSRNTSDKVLTAKPVQQAGQALTGKPEYPCRGRPGSEVEQRAGVRAEHVAPAEVSAEHRH
jgi:hypothetical protein